MGLDIYAGPLSRYYGGYWQTAIQQWGQNQGIPVNVVRPRNVQSAWRKLVSWMTSKGDPVARVQAWRAALAAQGHFPDGADWNWRESLDLPYETDKPDFDGYGAILLWAAYAEYPDAARPNEFPGDWSAHPIFVKASQQSSKFDHVLNAELWLPVQFDDVFETAEPNGAKRKVGSVCTLWKQLSRLNQLSWNADDATIRGWRQSDFEPEKLESLARWGFSILFCITEFAVQNRLPMRLDY